MIILFSGSDYAGNKVRTENNIWIKREQPVPASQPGSLILGGSKADIGLVVDYVRPCGEGCEKVPRAVPRCVVNDDHLRGAVRLFPN